MFETLRTRYAWPMEKPQVAPCEHGWFHPIHEQVFAQLLSDETRVIVELGSWLGKSATFFLQQAPQATLLCVDTWTGSIEHVKDARFRAILPILYETFLVNMWEYRDRLIPIRLPSVPGMWEIRKQDVPVDVVYVDASHEYEAVLADLWTAAHLFPEATIVCDDFADPFPGVKRALRAFAQYFQHGWQASIYGQICVLKRSS